MAKRTQGLKAWAAGWAKSSAALYILGPGVNLLGGPSMFVNGLRRSSATVPVTHFWSLVTI